MQKSHAVLGDWMGDRRSTELSSWDVVLSVRRNGGNQDEMYFAQIGKSTYNAPYSEEGRRVLAGLIANSDPTYSRSFKIKPGRVLVGDGGARKYMKGASPAFDSETYNISERVNYNLRLKKLDLEDERERKEQSKRNSENGRHRRDEDESPFPRRSFFDW